jgi:acyl-ACP thioesterase
MELIPARLGGRVFRQEVRAGLADCAPSGRVRLDALARWIQDVAYADVEDAGVADRAAWVVRRARVRVRRFPRFGEHLDVATFCSGFGRMWAERRTSISRVGGADGAGAGEVEAVALWVHLDPVARLPSPLTAEEVAIYAASAGDRRITARLRHPAPGNVQRSFPWRFRETECDLAGHINNAAYWQPLEEELLADGEPEAIDVEIEFRTPAQPGQKTVLCDGARRWIVGDAGETHASVRLAAVDG